MKHQAVTRRKDTRFAVALDSEQNSIQCRDIVKVVEGPHTVSNNINNVIDRNVLIFCVQGKEGEIKHLYRGFAFLHSKRAIENGGVFVARTRQLTLAGSSRVSFSLKIIALSPFIELIWLGIIS